MSGKQIHQMSMYLSYKSSIFYSHTHCTNENLSCDSLSVNVLVDRDNNYESVIVHFIKGLKLQIILLLSLVYFIMFLQ